MADCFDLVAHARDWPGVHSVRALTEGEVLEGVWYDRTELYERRRRGEVVSLEDVAQRETLVLSPLPCWRGLPDEEVRELASALVHSIDREAAERRMAEGCGVVGPCKVCRSDPRTRPQSFEPSSAPRFHAATQEALNELRQAYVEFAAQFQEAAELLRESAPCPPFPPDSFPPGLPLVPHQAPG